MRVIFMGTPDFAVGTFQKIWEAGHEIVLAVTQPDRPKGRGKSVTFSPVKIAAQERDIPVFQPQKIREPENIEQLGRYAADIIVVAAYGQILPKEILEMPKYGCINVHASLLPKYRGAAPIQWAVINGDPEAGVTIMQMDEGMDTGDMIDTVRVKLDPDETGGSLFEKLAKEGAALCVKVMKDLEDGTAEWTPQNDSQATHVGMISKSLGHIDWRKPAAEIERLIRGLNPWPSAYTYIRGKSFKLWKARVLPQEQKNKEPGTILWVKKDTIGVAAGDGVLEILEVQLEGKKRMPAGDFIRGFSLSEGEKFGE